MCSEICDATDVGDIVCSCDFGQVLDKDKTSCVGELLLYAAAAASIFLFILINGHFSVFL